MTNLTPVRRRTANKLATTNYVNELADAFQGAQALGPFGGASEGHSPWPGNAIWMVWDAGPAAEANYTDHRYWLRRALVTNTTGNTTTAVKLTEAGVSSPITNWISATNLSERPANTGGTETTGTHSLLKGTAIMGLWLEADTQTVGVWRFVFQSGGISGTFPVKVTKDGGVDGTNTTAATWTYTVKTMANVTMATAMALAHPREPGSRAFGTTYGTAFYDGSTLKLWSAGEIPATNACNT